MIATKTSTGPDAERLKPSNASSFDSLPDSAFVREAQLVRSPKRPHAVVPLPFSAPTLWRMAAQGNFPKPTRLSKRVTAWRVGDVRAWLAAKRQA